MGLVDNHMVRLRGPGKRLAARCHVQRHALPIPPNGRDIARPHCTTLQTNEFHAIAKGNTSTPRYESICFHEKQSLPTSRHV
jgi:hypothetical protein